MYYLEAFSNLTTCRQIGFDVGEIPWTAIVQYGCRTGLDDNMINVLVLIIRFMDGTYREWQKAEAERSAASKGKINKPQPGDKKPG